MVSLYYVSFPTTLFYQTNKDALLLTPFWRVPLVLILLMSKVTTSMFQVKPPSFYHFPIDHRSPPYLECQAEHYSTVLTPTILVNISR